MILIILREKLQRFCAVQRVMGLLGSNKLLWWYWWQSFSGCSDLKSMYWGHWTAAAHSPMFLHREIYTFLSCRPFLVQHRLLNSETEIIIISCSVNCCKLVAIFPCRSTYVREVAFIFSSKTFVSIYLIFRSNGVSFPLERLLFLKITQNDHTV